MFFNKKKQCECKIKDKIENEIKNHIINFDKVSSSMYVAAHHKYDEFGMELCMKCDKKIYCYCEEKQRNRYKSYINELTNKKLCGSCHKHILH